ncbi:unnamed protein product [Peronospora belbahrii]|uniref:RxLR effector protein n=1 Tax=Peronospora belbahrii TaxID=622444 RepID=A0ABN8CT67_9STRA|nr:unnamed protein product [Peronospora belbahrii]
MAATTQSRCVETLSTRPTSVFGKPTKSHEHAFLAQRSLRDGTEADAEDRMNNAFLKRISGFLGISKSDDEVPLLSASRLEEEALAKTNDLVSNYDPKRGQSFMNDYKKKMKSKGASAAIKKMAKAYLDKGNNFNSVSDLAVISMMDTSASMVAKKVLKEVTARWASVEKLDEIGLFNAFKLNDSASIRSFGLRDTDKSLLNHPLFQEWLEFVLNKYKQEPDKIAEVMEASFRSIDFDDLWKMWTALKNSGETSNKGVFHGAERAIVTQMSLQPGGLAPNRCFTFLNLDQLDKNTLLHTDQFHFWDEWFKKTSPDYSDKLVLKIMVENREGGDFSVAELLQLARRDDNTKDRASALQDLQMKEWLKNPPEYFDGKTPTVDSVYDYLSQKNDMIATQMFNVWIKYAQIAMKDDKENAFKAAVTALWSKMGEEGTFQFLKKACSNEESVKNADELLKAAFLLLGENKIFPGDVILKLPIDTTNPKFFERRCLSELVTYSYSFFANHDNPQNLAQILDDKLHTVAVTSLIYHLGESQTAKTLQRLQFEHWRSLDPMNIFGALKLGSDSQFKVKLSPYDSFVLGRALNKRNINAENLQVDYRLLENELLYVWITFMKESYQNNSNGIIADVLATFYEGNGGIANLMRMIDSYKDLNLTQNLAAELRRELIDRLIRKKENIPSVMKMFGLNDQAEKKNGREVDAGG